MRLRSTRLIWFIILLLPAACGRELPGAAAPTLSPAVPAATTIPAVPATDAPPVEGSVAILLPAGATADGDAFAAALSAAGAAHAVHYAPDGVTQLAQAEAALAAGARVLVLLQTDDEAGAAVIDRARAAGVEVIGFRELTTTGPGPDLFVGYDDVWAGRLIGETLAPLIDGLNLPRPRVAVLNGPPDDYRAALLRGGLDEALAPRLAAGEWELAADMSAPHWETAALPDDVGADGAIQAVFATDDRLAAAVADATAPGLPPPLLSGRGATLDAVRRLLSGTQTMTLYTPARLEIAAATAAAVNLLRGDEIPSLTSHTIPNGQNDVPFIRLRPIPITRDDIDPILVADGYLTWEAICGQSTCPEEP